MAYAPVSIGDTVNYHQRRGHGLQAIDAEATVAAVDGTRIDLEGDRFSAASVENIDFVGDRNAAVGYWSNLEADAD